MPLKNKISLIILGLVGQLVFSGHVGAEPLEASDNLSKEEILLSALIPEQHHRALIAFYPFIVEDEVIGGVAVYDDPTTARPADRWELYDSEGDLLAVSWFDQFGIERMAVDHGLLEEAERPEGVFVVFLDGESL
jgi:hypothetical protein